MRLYKNKILRAAAALITVFALAFGLSGCFPFDSVKEATEAQSETITSESITETETFFTAADETASDITDESGIITSTEETSTAFAGLTTAVTTVVTTTAPSTTAATTTKAATTTTKPSTTAKAATTTKSGATRVNVTSSTAATAKATTAAPATTKKAATTSSFKNRFCYTLLNSREREIYSTLYNSAASGGNTFSMRVPDADFIMDELERAIYGFCYDFPEYCRFDRSFSVKYSNADGYTNYTAKVNLCSFCGSGNGSEYESTLAAKAKQVASAAGAFSSDFDRIKYVHDYLCDNTKYNTASYFGSLTGPDYQLAHCAYGALINGRAVCDGYANAFVYVMHELGYECGQVTGKSQGQNHAWNIIKVGGEYYYMDVTWDDGDGTGTSYEYFCIPKSRMSKDHNFDTLYAYPNATSESLNFFKHIGCEMDSYDYDTAAAIIDKQKDNDVIFIKFTNAEAYKAAMNDLSRLSDCIRKITGRNAVKYNNSSTDNLIKFYT